MRLRLFLLPLALALGSAAAGAENAAFEQIDLEKSSSR